MNAAAKRVDPPSQDQNVRDVVADQLGGEVRSLARIGGGANSRVYQLTCADDRHYRIALPTSTERMRRKHP
jgi:hypothetical protein